MELLLRYGADPFTENPAGKTPLDLALEARAVNIVRACERQALFAGYVGTRVSRAPATYVSLWSLGCWTRGPSDERGFSFATMCTCNTDVPWLSSAPSFAPPQWNVLSVCLSVCLSPLQVGQLKGFSYTSKDRWVVIAPRFTPPPPGGSVGEVRVMMLLFRNAGEAEPRTKVWLDGAAISMAAGEALLVSD